MMELNVDNAGGELRRVSMDGTDVQMHIQGFDGLPAMHLEAGVIESDVLGFRRGGQYQQR